jgi:hypothetical protein
VKLAHLALAAALPLWAPAQDMSVDSGTVLLIARQRVESADYRIAGHLVRVDASDARTSVPIAIKVHAFPGVLRVLVEVSSPAAARERILLEMPRNGKTTIQIAHPGDTAPAVLAFDRWSDGPLGPGFSYEDFIEPQYFWPFQKEVGKAAFGARDCIILSSTPGAADRTHYSEVRTWLDHAIGFPVYVEKTMKGLGIVKEFTYFGLRHDQGAWSAGQIEVKIRGRSGSMLLIIDRGSAKANLTQKDFLPDQLIHF